MLFPYLLQDVERLLFLGLHFFHEKSQMYVAIFDLHFEALDLKIQKAKYSLKAGHSTLAFQMDISCSVNRHCW